MTKNQYMFEVYCPTCKRVTVHEEYPVPPLNPQLPTNVVTKCLMCDFYAYRITHDVEPECVA